MRRNQPPAIASFVREHYFAGCHDPEELARKYLDAALAADNPEAWLLQPIRHAVGSSFSSLQAAIRGTTQSSGGGSAHGTSGGPSRQRHNDGFVYNPWERVWVPLGKATVPDFEAAILWHQNMITGHENTIDEYRGYIQRIKEAGVTCLDEI